MAESPDTPPRQLGLTSWAIDNKTASFLLTFFIALFGFLSYNSLPKEQFPEVAFPTILVNTLYPGASPEQMEKLVTKELEDEINTITEVRKIQSKSIQDFSTVIVEFETSADVDEAKQLVKDAVDRAKSELPNDLDEEPEIKKVEINDLPIMYVNLVGDFDDLVMKNYAEDVQDAIEELKAINRVDLVGVNELEMQVNIDMYRMHMAGLALSDIDQALAQRNVNISGGLVDLGELQYAMRISGEFETADEINNLVVRSARKSAVKIQDIGNAEFTFEEPKSYARLDGEKVVTLAVIKRAGENLISTAEEIHALLDELKATTLPKEMRVDVFGDTSDATATTLNDLVNTIVLGFMLVALVLMFFMGVNNALFVGMAVPLSSFIAFMVIPGFGFTLNIVVLFALLLALGILVDNAIVVVENTYRIFDNGKRSIQYAAKYGAAEVFAPVLAGTLTTLAPFFPLLFWPGVTGKFMKYLPATLIVTLGASLFVAFVINPVFAVQFMKPLKLGKKNWNRFLLTTGLISGLSLLFYLLGATAVGNLGLFVLLLVVLTRFVFEPAIRYFQKKSLPALESRYEKIVGWSVRRPWLAVGITALVWVGSLSFFTANPPDIVFFPEPQPKLTYVYISLPVGTNTDYTDSIAKVVERRVQDVIAPDRDIIEAVLTNVAISAGDPSPTAFEGGTKPELAKVTVSYVEFGERNGKSSLETQNRIREAVNGIVPGATITVEKEQSGPPTGAPINVEVTGDTYDEVVQVARRFMKRIEDENIPGIENLETDVDDNKPEVVVVIDKERADREGISVATIGNSLRTAVNGKDVSKYRLGDEQYPIMLRLKEEYRDNLNALRDLNIAFQDMKSGTFKQVPLSAVADFEYRTTYGGVLRKNLKSTVNISSNVLDGYNANAIVREIGELIPQFEKPDGVEIKMTGEQEDQIETANFLSTAMLISFLLIFFILTATFNSIGKTLIILVQVFLSVGGVFLGYSLFQMEFSIVMTGVGIIALAGVVVNNGILLIEFTDQLKKEKWSTKAAIVEAGKIRLKPVLLTAASTILGLVPLAIGLNINFYTLFTELRPNIYLGGDNVVFWGPLSWTLIFGLLYATLLTLIVVPALYLIYYRSKLRFKRAFLRLGRKLDGNHRQGLIPDPGTFSSNGHDNAPENPEETPWEEERQY